MMINDIWKFELKRGNGHNPQDGACLMDAISWFEYGTLGDRPACVSPVLAAFCRNANDVMTDVGRQKLKTYIPRLIGSVDNKQEKARAEHLVWQAIRVFSPFWLDKAGMTEEAKFLRDFKGTILNACSELKRIEAYAYASSASASVAAASTVAYAASAASAAAYAYAASASASVAAASAAAYAASAASEWEPLILSALSSALTIGKQGTELAPERIALANELFQRARECA